MRSLIPWRWKENQVTPDNTLTEFRREVDDLFNQFFGSSGWLPVANVGRGFTPVLDVSETDEDLLIKAELPGVDPKEIEVNLSGTTLTVKGEKKRSVKKRLKMCIESKDHMEVFHDPLLCLAKSRKTKLRQISKMEY